MMKAVALMIACEVVDAAKVFYQLSDQCGSTQLRVGAPLLPKLDGQSRISQLCNP
jgi:hypothetical protein